MTPAELWSELLERLAASVGEDDVERFLRPLAAVGVEGGRLHLEAPSEALARVVCEQFLPLLREEASNVLGQRMTVEVSAASPQRELFPALTEGAASLPAGTPTNSKGTDSGLVPSYTFDLFVQGATTQFAHAAALAVARQPAQQYNPLFLYGPTGCGKTHLLHAIGNYVLALQPTWRVRYVTADTFMTELVSALRKQRISSFKQRYRQLDLLLVDDVHTLAHRERTQEEFFHLFNSLYDRGRQIVLAAADPPQKIAGLEERLANRFQWGLLADVQPPDLETRIAILQRKAEAEQIELPQEVATYIATHLASSARELHGCLIRLAALASLKGSDINLQLAAEVVHPSSKQGARPLTIERVQQVVAEFFGIRPAELRSKRRDRSVSVPRQIAMYLCRRHLLASFPTIGERFGRRDHTTAMHAVQTIERRVKEEPSLHMAVQQIEQALFGESL